MLLSRFLIGLLYKIDIQIVHFINVSTVPAWIRGFPNDLRKTLEEIQGKTVSIPQKLNKHIFAIDVLPLRNAIKITSEQVCLHDVIKKIM